MTATGHALVAALIAAKFHDPATAYILSFASHFLCDVLPHWDGGTHYEKKSKKTMFYESAFDVGLSVVAAYLAYSTFLGQTNLFHLYLSVFIAQLPDWLTAPYFIFKMKIPLSIWFYHIQHKLNTKLDKPWGILTQIAFILMVYILLFHLLG